MKEYALMMRTSSVSFAAGAALVLSAGVAAAAPAVARADLNMRSGPGAGYAVVETIPGGATVDVLGCGGSWCHVAYAGETGYASRSYLGLGGAAAAASEEDLSPPAVAYGYPDYNEPYYHGYGPGVDLGVYTGDGLRGGWRYGRNFRYGAGPRARDGNWAGRGGWQAGRTSAPARQGGAANPAIRTGENLGGRAAMGSGPGGGRASASGNAGMSGGGPYARQ